MDGGQQGEEGEQAQPGMARGELGRGADRKGQNPACLLPTLWSLSHVPCWPRVPKQQAQLVQHQDFPHPTLPIPARCLRKEQFCGLAALPAKT
jgi:hypothetical protein